jgi:hypothetical protein
VAGYQRFRQLRCTVANLNKQGRLYTQGLTPFVGRATPDGRTA